MKKKVKAKLEKLKRERKTIKQYSIFGDDNWKRLDVQIEILERLLKKCNRDTLLDLEEKKIKDIEDTYGEHAYGKMSEEREP